MRKEVMEYIKSKPELKQYLREQPIWYRKLARNPDDLKSFEISAMHYYKRTIPHRVEKISNGLQMASMMLSMFQAMNSGQT